MQTALAVAAAAMCAAASPAVAAEVGDAGIGDPLFPKAGNGGYDVSHYDLALRYQAQTGELIGDATVRMTPSVVLKRFDMDLRAPLRVRRVWVDGEPVEARLKSPELVITPPAPISADQEHTVQIRYRGVPRSMTLIRKGDRGWVPTDDGVWVTNEPNGASSWFPCNDHPSDKATFTMRIDAPSHRKAVANGQLVDRQPAPGGRSIWVWDMSEPMATYLASVSIGRFDLDTGNSGATESVFATDPRVRDKDIRTIRRVEPATRRFLREKFGP